MESSTKSVEIVREAYTQIRVPVASVPALRERVAKLAKRAAAKGLGEFRCEWTGLREREERKVAHGGDVVSVFAEFEIWKIYSPAPLRIDGWELAARVEHAEGGNILHTVSGAAVVPVEFRETKARRCDHCHTARARVDSFIVVNAETGEYKQVGRSCLADFLGRDPQVLLGWYRFVTAAVASLAEEAEGWGAEARSRPMFSVEFVLGLAARVGAVDGYRPAAFGEDSTKSAVLEWACAKSRLVRDEKTRRFLAAMEEKYPAETRRVEQVRFYIASLRDELAGTPMSALSDDYRRNLKAALASDGLDWRSIGLVVSVVAAACKRADEAAKATGPDLSGSVAVGKVGERLRGLDGTVEFVRGFESQYGAGTLVKFSVGGNLFVWWATGTHDLKAGDRVRVTGTVKAHEEDRFAKATATVLSRCTLDLIG